MIPNHGSYKGTKKGVDAKNKKGENLVTSREETTEQKKTGWKENCTATRKVK